MSGKQLNVTIWNEYRHEKADKAVARIYPEGIHGTIRSYLAADDPSLNIRLAALDDPCQGFPGETLDQTDVLLWWGHMAHEEVTDALADRICARVRTGGMGLIVLHSGHYSKVFRRLAGTNGNLSWGRDQHEIVWNLLPSHPIAAGIPDHFELFEEMYAEPFYVPQPDELVFGGWFEDGYLFRSGLCYYRGAGKIFYFQPGHEYCRSFHDPHVRRIILNAIRWAAPNEIGYGIPDGCPCIEENLTERFRK